MIESVVSPASAASLPPGTYALRLSSEQCNPTPVLDPSGAPPPATCASLAGFTSTDHQITSQSQLDALGITIDNCRRRYLMQVTSGNPKVTITVAGSASGNARTKGQCVTPTSTGSQVTWDGTMATDRNGYFIIITVTA
jgi:hypothetical protein